MMHRAFAALLAAIGLAAGPAFGQALSDDTRDTLILELLDRIERLEGQVGTLTRELERERGQRHGEPEVNLSLTPAVAPGYLGNVINGIGRVRRPDGSLGGPRYAPRPSPPLAQAQAAPAAPAEQEPPDDSTGAVVHREDLRGLEAALQRRNLLLLPPGGLEVETSYTYSHSSFDAISIEGFALLPVLVIGDIVSERVRRDTLIGEVSARVGLPFDSQADISIPYRYVSSERITASQPAEEIDDENDGIGDIQIGLSNQVFFARGPWPDVLARIEWKPPTAEDPFENDADLALGTGFHSIRPTVTFVKAVDPAVLIASLSYTFNLEDNKPVGDVDPGDIVGISIASAVALSTDLSINFGWSQDFQSKSTVDGFDVPGSSGTVGKFQFGFSYILTDQTSVDFSLGVGLTSDAPDLDATLAFPIRLW